jgi:hypothetical protein
MEFSVGKNIGAAQILYLADKMVCGENLVDIEERFRLKLERYCEEPAILDRINKRLKVAWEIKRRIERSLGSPLENALKQ